jgi:hypothetical protein
MNFIKPTVYVLAIVAVGFVACGDDDLNGSKMDSGLPNGTGGQGGRLGGTGGAGLDGAIVTDTRNDNQADAPIPVDGTQDSRTLDGGGFDVPILDAPVDGVMCSTPNPTLAKCRRTPNDCTPSTCVCNSEGYWVCTADCRTDLPICSDGGVLTGDAQSMSLVDAGEGAACGAKICGVGTYCCNVSCGLCAPLAGGCITLECESPKTWACVKDTDCRLKSDYCDGCHCLALGPGGSAPSCKGTPVQCLLDPCSLKSPRCLNGLCVAAVKSN